jgi:hypothetical protein
MSKNAHGVSTCELARRVARQGRCAGQGGIAGAIGHVFIELNELEPDSLASRIQMVSTRFDQNLSKRKRRPCFAIAPAWSQQKDVVNCTKFLRYAIW